MAQNQLLPILFQPSLAMNSDLSPLAARSGSQIDNLNVGELTQGGGTTTAIEPKKGNEYIFSLPIVTTQNKIYRVYLDSSQTSPTARDLDWINANGVLVATATYTPTSGDLATTYTDASTAITGAYTTVTLGALITTSTNAGYFSLQITSNPTWDYTIELDGAKDEPLPIITQEAVDASLAGQLLTIGSFNLNGDLFIWSTPQTNLPSEISVTGAANNGSGKIRIAVASTADLSTNGAVTISGVLGTTEANGIWIITVISATTFDLKGSVFTNAYVSHGTVILNAQGVGEIGVAQKDWNDGTWTYTTLLRSAEFNFRTKKQPKIVCQRNNLLASLYWTDNYNPYRRLYYQGAYTTNGALNFVDPLNIYFYGQIFNQTRLFQDNGIGNIEFSAQLQSGGGLLAGNYRYVIRFLDEFFNPTLWSDPSGIFVTYANPSSPNTQSIGKQIFGDNSYDPTPKINQINVTGIIPNLFKYVELGALYYVDGTPIPVGTVVSRTLLTQDTSQILQHTGNEVNTQTLDLSTLLATQPDILTGLGIEIVANRLIPSNTTSHAIIDYQAWIDTFKYSLLMDSVQGIGVPFYNQLNVGEYQLPENTFGKLGFMLNETYRISAKLEFLNGAYSENFWFDDITFNKLTSITYTVETGVLPDDDPITFTGGGTGFVGHDDGAGAITVYGLNQPIAAGNLVTGSSDSFTVTGVPAHRQLGLPFMDLTDNAGQNVYVPYLNITDIDPEFKILDTPVKNTVKRIHWEMVEMIPQFRNVLASGAVAMGVSYELDIPTGGYIFKVESDYPCTNGLDINIAAYRPPDTDSSIQHIVDNPFVEGAYMVVGSDEYQYSVETTPERQYMSFYAPDCLFNNTFINDNLGAGHQLIVFGQSSVKLATSVLTGESAAMILSAEKEFSGFVNDVNNTFYTISEVENIDRDGSNGFASLGGGRNYCKASNVDSFFGTDDPRVTSRVTNPSSAVINTSSDVTFQGVGTDYGFYMAQYYRPIVNKFGNQTLSKYIPTGTITEYLGTSANVYGDTFNQKTWFKRRQVSSFENVNNLVNSCGSVPFTKEGFGGGIGFYSQNRVNSQMINRSDSGTAWSYPDNSLENWLTNLEPTNPLLIYSTGYNDNQSVTSDSAFDPDLPQADSTPARFWWSLNKPENSIADLFTVILPLNFRDEDLTYSPIYHTVNLNGQLMTFQQGHYNLQYFDNTGLIASNSSDVVFGNSGVAAQRGTTMTTYGTKHGFSVIIGRSKGGKQTAYWIDTTHGKVMRWQETDGSVCISDAHNMRWFFNNYLTFADLANTPADGQGICGVWDDQNSEAIWTVRAKKSVDTYDTDTTYSKYDEVFYQPPTYSTFEQTGEIYISLVDNNVSLPTDTARWKLVPHWGNDVLPNGEYPYNYYNEYTITYNEVKDKFTTRYSYLPKIYLKLGKTFLAPRPVENQNKIFEYYTKNSEYCVWFRDLSSVTSDIEQAENWFIGGMIVNYDPNLPKRANTMEWQTKIVPYKIYIESKKYSTFMVAADCEARFDGFVVAVKNNLLNGANDADESANFGSWFSVKLEGIPRVYQNLFNFVMKVLIKSRNYKE